MKWWVINKQKGKFEYQTIKPPNCSSYKANTGHWIKTDNADVVDANYNMPDYFRSSINKASDKRASQILMQKIQK